jgi:hypothetical protein
MAPVTGWQAVLMLVVGAFIAALLVAALVSVGAVLALCGVVIWLNWRVLPGAASRLGVPRVALDALLLVGLAGGGWLLSGVTGSVVGGVIWLAGIATPRLAAMWLRWRMRRAVGAASAGTSNEPANVVVLETCPRLGLASANPSGLCPACGAELARLSS